MNKLGLLALLLFVIVIIGLFIELSYNKAHSEIAIIAPSTFTVLDSKYLGKDDIIIIYNSERVSMDEVLNSVDPQRKHNYRELAIRPHISKKITKPFNDSYEEIKNGEAEVTPMSFMYKTAIGIVDIAHEITTANNKKSAYRMLYPTENKHYAFIDDGNIYIR